MARCFGTKEQGKLAVRVGYIIYSYTQSAARHFTLTSKEELVDNRQVTESLEESKHTALEFVIQEREP